MNGKTVAQVKRVATQSSFSSYIIGGSTLAVRCAELLTLHGHKLYGIISSDTSFLKWAGERDIPYIGHEDDLTAFLTARPFDYLFSIVNDSILPEDILRLPRRCAINYHNSLLPKYAGTNATAWAIMNKEKTHGVTWHVMSAQIDAGDSLKQCPINIADGETTVTLSMKCYDAAASAFNELIGDLARGEIAPTRQNLNERTFYPRNRMPLAGGVIRWASSVDDIDALNRGLEFGPYPNPLGLPKIAIGEDFLIATGIKVSHLKPEAAHGTITNIDGETITVSVPDGEVILSKLLTVDGKQLPVDDLVATYGLHQGYRFKDLDQETAGRITKYSSLISQHEMFWVERLAALQPITLPYEARNLSGISTAECVCAPMTIPEEVYAFLESHNASLSASDFIYAAFAVYLARLNDVSNYDVEFKDAEQQRDIEGLEGFFASHVPLHMDIDFESNFEKSFRAVHDQLNLIRQHKTYARDAVMRYPALRSASGLQKSHAMPISVEIVERLDKYEGRAGNHLTFVITKDRAECCWIYNANLLDRDCVARMQDQFVTLVRGIAAHPDQPVYQLPLITPRERHRLLVEWNDTRADYPQDSCVHELFEAQVERTPDAVAVAFEDERLTYRELNRRANQLAHYLQKLGVGPEVLVGICIERCPAMVVGLLGILKAGGAYVPLDPSYPKERLRFMLTDSRVPVLLTQESLLPHVHTEMAQVVRLDTDRQAVLQESDENLVSGAAADNLAYVIYTSGSTGEPKGAMIPHRGLVNYLTWCTQSYPVDAGRGAPVHSSISFDLTITALFTPLLAGRCAQLLPQDFGVEILSAELRDGGDFSFVKITPAHLELLNQQPALHEIARNTRAFIIGGENLLAASISKWQEAAPEIVLVNEYGPTETVVGCCTYRVPNGQHESGSIPIGRPIANTQLYILDRHLEPVPVGVPGELYIGGVGVARGYLNRPELTAEKFVHNPFSDQPGSRLYKTSDLVRYLPDGNIEFLGRTDHQVKVRGYRIELGEIEASLDQHPGVRENTVIVREDVPGDRRLIAYLVLDQAQPATTSELRDFLKKKLPDYMMPSAFVPLEALPLTSNGKVDRKALPAPGHTSHSFVAPRSMLEFQLAKIWEDVLGVQAVSVSDNFFELGGNSLLAVRLFAEVERVCGRNLPLATLFQAQTVEQLADVLSEEGWAAPWSSLVAIQAGGTKPPFFCVHGIGGNVLWYADLARHLGSDQPFYGLQAQGLDGRIVSITRVEEMAAHYIDEVRKLQPEGPYFLGGASFGGLVAYEMAQQLHLQGEKVALLALFDTEGPGYPKYLPGTTLLRRRVYSLVRKVEHHWNGLSMLSHRDKLKYILPNLRNAQEMFKRRIKSRIKKRVKRGKEIARKFYVVTGLPLPRALQETQNVILKAKKRYVPKVYPGRVTLFRASMQPLGIYPDPTLGWNGLVAGGLDVYETPGYHENIVVEPWVGLLVEKFKEVLNKAQSPEPVEEILTLATETSLSKSNGKVDRKALPAPGHTSHSFVAPRSMLEFQLAKIWEDVLGVQAVSLKDNFFELGGNSLLAVRLFAEVERVCGRNLPLATLFEAQTVEQLADVLSEEGWAAPWSSLVAIQAGGTKPPFFCVHGIGGNVLGYRDLANHLGHDRPVYGLQAQGLDGRIVSITRVEEMAAHYIDEVRKLQPEGPYYLGGASFGGLVAYEMAQQLHRQGEKVALLALFDTPGPGYEDVSVGKRILWHLDVFAQLDSQAKLKYALSRAKAVKKRVDYAVWRREVKSQRSSESPLPNALRKVQMLDEQAKRDYTPKVYPGRVTLFKASIQDIARDDPQLGWGTLVAGGLDVREVPGNHTSLIREPHVRVLGEQLKACLDEAHTNH